MRIYTGTGDGGETSTLSGQKVSKNDAVIHFEGMADELNSHLGLIKAMLPDRGTRQCIEEIQINLMKIMAHVSDRANERYFLGEDAVNGLEREIDRLSANLPPLSEMVVPGKNATEAHIHIARAVARRTERLLVAVNAEHPLCRNAGVYLNRLSDYLFVLARME
jgi:cob(I)alamin adenosyltransferase